MSWAKKQSWVWISQFIILPTNTNFALSILVLRNKDKHLDKHSGEIHQLPLRQLSCLFPGLPSPQCLWGGHQQHRRLGSAAVVTFLLLVLVSHCTALLWPSPPPTVPLESSSVFCVPASAQGVSLLQHLLMASLYSRPAQAVGQYRVVCDVLLPDYSCCPQLPRPWQLCPMPLFTFL